METLSSFISHVDPRCCVHFYQQLYPHGGTDHGIEKYDYKLGMFKSPKDGLDNFTYLFATKDARILPETHYYIMQYLLSWGISWPLR